MNSPSTQNDCRKSNNWLEQSQRALALKAEERDRSQGLLRERERGMEGSRQQVLKLLGEASGLKNQLAQIDQYLVGINRDVERIQRDEASANNDRERLEALKAELTQKQSVRQLELQTTVEQRRNSGRGALHAQSACRRSAPQAGRTPGGNIAA